MVVNLATPKSLGLVTLPSVLTPADEAIESAAVSRRKTARVHGQPAAPLLPFVPQGLNVDDEVRGSVPTVQSESLEIARKRHDLRPSPCSDLA